MKTKKIIRLILGLCLPLSVVNVYSQAQDESLRFNQLMTIPARNSVTNLNVNDNARPDNNSNSTLTSKINDASDVRIFPTTNLQISPSICINKQNPNSLVISCETFNISSNMTNQGYFYTANAGASWSGAEQLPNNPLSLGGKPRTAFNNSGRAYIIGENGSGYFLQSSTNGGSIWSNQTLYLNIADGVENTNMTTDNSPTSPYVNRYYGAWTLADGVSGASKKVLFHKSIDNGILFTPPNTSEVILKVGYNQGPNVQTGPNGEVYVCWSDRSTGTPNNGTGLGFCRSLDGGVSFNAYQKVLNYQGIGTGIVANPIFNNTMVFDFPSMAVDKSPGIRRGRIYVAVPVKENGNGKSIIQVSYSDNQGTTWSALNTISIPTGRQNWFPFITVDDCTGEVWVIYYSFDTASGFTTNTYVARSADNGITWENQKISDAGHITAPVPNSTKYAGMQIGITAYGGKAHAIWSDNRSPNTNWQLYYSPVTGSAESNISGTANMCTIGNYSLTGFPPTATVTWSASTTSPQVTVTNTGQSTVVTSNGYLGLVTLTATVVNGCGTYRYTKQIQIVPGTSVTPAGQQATCKHLGGSYIPMLACNQFLQSDVVLPCPDGIIDPCYLQMQGRVIDPLATNISFSIVYSTSLSNATLTTAGNTFTVTCRRWPNTGYVIVRCTTSNSCGSAYKDYTFYITNPCPGGNPEQRMTEITQSADDQNQVSKLAISPNPSTGQFVLALNTAHKTSLIKEVIITNKMGAVVYQQKFYSGQKTQTINLSDQSTDTYIAQVFDGKEWHAQKLALRK